MEYLKIRNWEKYQHYSHRRPPWIKIYWSLLTEPNFTLMADASKLHTIAIMLLASQHDNKIPFNKSWISRAIQANSRINWNEILASGFIECYQDASAPLALCQQVAIPRARSRETETETETETDPPIPPEGVSVAPNGSFAKFWAVYPKKVGKGKAEASWKRIRASPNVLMRILDAIEAQKRSHDWIKNNGEFIPHPATWLNQRRWEDEIKPEVEFLPLETETTHGKRGSGQIPSQPDSRELPAIQARQHADRDVSQ